MANVGFQQMATGSLKAGASKTITWKNAPGQSVWAFSVQADDVTGEELLPGTIAFEITRVVYQLIAPGKRTVLVTVKNSGTFDWAFTLFLARISA